MQFLGFLILEELIEYYLLDMLRLLLYNQGSEKIAWNSRNWGSLLELPFLVIAAISAFWEHFPKTFSAPNSVP